MTGTDVMTKEQVGITVIFFLDPASSRHQSQGMVRIVGTKVPEEGIPAIKSLKRFL